MINSITQEDNQKHSSPIKYSKYIFAILIACTLISTYNLIYVQSLPTTTIKHTVLATYQQTGSYDYTAKLLPNLIYNKDTMKPDQGILYTKITDYVNITFSYKFSSSPNYNNLTVRRQLVTWIESPGVWTRTLTEQEALEIFNIMGEADFSMKFNSTKVKQFIEQIDSEIGVTTTLYSIKVSPFYQITTNIGGKAVNDFLDPELTIQFGDRRDEDTNMAKGNYISFEGLKYSEYQEIATDETITIPGLQERLFIVYAITAILVLALIGYSIYYIRSIPRKKSKKPSSKIASEYRDLLIETTGPPPDTKATITEKKIQDLAKTAEIIGKPIIHISSESKDTYYVIDGDTKYVFETET